MPQTEVILKARVQSFEEVKRLIQKVQRMEKECSCHCTLNIELYY